MTHGRSIAAPTGILASLLAALVLVLACAPGGSAPASTTNLTVLAGSELKDLEPLLPDLEKATGYHLSLSYAGSLDGAERIVKGDRSQLAWFSSGKYLNLLQGSSGRVVAQDRIMLSPVVIGVKHSTAQRLGWSGNPNVTWSDIGAASKAGQFHFAMTNPTASNSGFVALVGVATALAPNGDALAQGNINVAALKDFFAGQALTAGSSGWLADSYVRSQGSLDGIVNYESVLLTLNQGNQLRDKLDLVYPKEGIVTADYPLMLLDRSQRSAFDKITSYLRRTDVQARIMRTTARRPAEPGVQLDSRFSTQVLIELPFPSSLDVVNKLLFAYLDQIRKPAHAIFVLDTSGSMDGARIDSLKRALNDLTGADSTLSGQFASFRQREEVTMILFNTTVYQQRDFIVNDTGPSSPDLAAIRSFVNSLRAGGGTAIYDAVETAYQVAARDIQQEPDRYYSVVLMTDGENNNGHDVSHFLSTYQRLPADVRAVKTFTILFGEAQPKQLSQIADTTGGRVFDSRSAPLTQVFKEIRGYQ
ncbi:MAG: substrate-binding and VWA domain-containing protein [Candidatus Dormibacteraeota bacterium]|nr:substrate-binding and VWA domain-containing protein [Candidatus Dormibacteraeota bacterium]MDQ6920134.1 substrate-binding and VWA domain-containing protein [Candidatus Dormibacteraeota bacterium]